jgi:glutaredoxin
MTERQLQDVALYRMDLPGHACPWGLKALALLQEQQIPFQEHRRTSEAEVQAFKDHHKAATTLQILSDGLRFVGYSDLAALL